MPSPCDPTTRPRTLDVRGALPPGLHGRLVGIGPDGAVHVFHVGVGRVSHLVRSLGTAAAVHELVAFDGSVLAYGLDSSVRQLTLDACTSRRVDLAGHGRTVAACPTHDAVSGELHLVTGDWGGTQLHVVVPAGALTRRSRPIADARGRIRGLAVGNDHVVFVADGVVGVALRDGDGHTTWTATGTVAPQPVHTHRTGDTVALVALTPSLERWILHPDGSGIQREVLDPTPRRFARSSGAVGGSPGFVWSTGGETVGRHDLSGTGTTHLDLAPGSTGDFVVVPDTARPGAGWFVGFVHHASEGDTDLVVIDTTDFAGAATATIRIPRPVPHGLRCTWLPPTRNDLSTLTSPKADTP